MIRWDTQKIQLCELVIITGLESGQLIALTPFQQNEQNQNDILEILSSCL